MDGHSCGHGLPSTCRRPRPRHRDGSMPDLLRARVPPRTVWQPIPIPDVLFAGGTATTQRRQFLLNAGGGFHHRDLRNGKIPHTYQFDAVRSGRYVKHVLP